MSDLQLQLQREHAVLLRLARLLAEESDETELLTRVVEEAAALIGGNRGHMRRWDPERELLHVVAVVPRGRQMTYPAVALGQGHSGQAALEDAPLLLQDYWVRQEANGGTWRTDALAGIAVPLRVGKCLLGTLAFGSGESGLVVTEGALQTIAVLGSLAAAALVRQERARLNGVLLAARTAAHELDSTLARTVRYAELAAQQPGLPPATAEMLGEALSGAQSAAATLARLQRVVRLREADLATESEDAVLDLERSSSSSSTQAPREEHAHG